MTLDKFLSLKPLFYDEIDYDRFPNIYKKYKNYFALPKVIHVVGTNAKGSTGRALAHMLHVKGFNVGHYSSPHILKFNERIWLDGEDIDDNALEMSHKELQNILDKDTLKVLSYFEYTTLLAMLIFCKKCDYIVLEAGLGGEFDATNVFEKNLSIITPIGYDHKSFLGNSIKEIATTKINSVKNDCIIAKQYEEKVYEIAHNRVHNIGSNLYFAHSYLSDEFYDELSLYIKNNFYANYFFDNFSTAFCALKLLGFDENVDLLEGFKLLGRCQKIAPNITIDVGHNVMAAKVLAEHFSQKKVILVYNSYVDKEYKKILEILKPIITCVEILKVENKRVVEKQKLFDVLNDLEISYKDFELIKEEKEYLIFGSFSVVEEFLKGYKID